MYVEFSDDEIKYVPDEVLNKAMEKMREIASTLAKYTPQKKHRF